MEIRSERDPLSITQTARAASTWAMRTSVLCLALFCLAGAASPEQSAGTYNWRAHMLWLHNEVRARLNLPPMEWSPSLEETSRYWAAELLQSGAFEHDGDHRHGQNLFAITGGRATVPFVFQAWASEASSYDYMNNSCSDMCGHYTQIVWRNTLNVGCALARNEQREVWVCDYSPTGNVVGRRPY